MSESFEDDAWKKELKRGILEMCILSLLSTREMYGYEISKELDALSGGILRIEEGTLYPLLRRLEERGYLKGEWRYREGKARRYYKITPRGMDVLRKMRAFWAVLITVVNNILYGGESGGRE
ncbi:MAG: PadR family transcriptional regulator [Candidatus Baldrarchaeia archaeon]